LQAKKYSLKKSIPDTPTTGYGAGSQGCGIAPFSGNPHEPMAHKGDENQAPALDMVLLGFALPNCKSVLYKKHVRAAS
jgi:hypothetical protein